MTIDRTSLLKRPRPSVNPANENRLRESMLKHWENEEKTGYDEGVKWALNRANALDLHLLGCVENYEERYLNNDEIGTSMTNFCNDIEDEGIENFEDVQVFWLGATVAHPKMFDRYFVYGFACGARDVWDVVKDAVLKD